MAERRSKTMLNAVVATTTSDGVDISLMKKVSILIKATDVSGGESGVFTIEVSNDQGATWVAYNRIVSNVTNTNGQTDTRVASVTLSALGSSADILLFPVGDHFGMMRIKCTVTGTHGKFSAYLTAI